MEDQKLITGGGFLVSVTDPKDVFIPEEFDEEQKMIGQTCQDFLDTEVFPVLDKIDAQEEGLMPELLKKAGELDSWPFPYRRSWKDSDSPSSPPCMPVRSWARAILLPLLIPVIRGSVPCPSCITEMRSSFRNTSRNWPAEKCWEPIA